MGLITKGGVKSPPNANSSKVEFDIKDTEFLMRLLNNSGIGGSDIEQAYTTLQKIKKLHLGLMETKVKING